MIITSDKSFFERLGYVQGQPPPQTDENILSAVVHLDETTPHLQLYYVPLVDTGKKKVYAKAPDGKVLRNEKARLSKRKTATGSPYMKK